MPPTRKNLTSFLEQLFDDRSSNNCPPKTSKEMAAFLGISQSQWSKLKRGKVRFTKKTADRIARAVKLSEETDSDIVDQLHLYIQKFSDNDPVVSLGQQKLQELLEYHEHRAEYHQKKIAAIKTLIKHGELTPLIMDAVKTIRHG